MPHSVFTGRPMPGPGEPLFTEDDTAAAIALAEEERDTCPSCHMPKAWCREGSLVSLGKYEVHEETCWITYRLGLHQGDDNWKGKPDHVRRSAQLSVRFREGQEPDLEAGLGLAGDDQQNEGQ